MVEPVCESALARQADVPHLQHCSWKWRAWAPAQEDADALCQSHLPAHFPLSEHSCVQKVSDDGPRGWSRYCELLFLPWRSSQPSNFLSENIFYSFIHSFKKHLLNTYPVPETVLRGKKGISHHSCPQEAYLGQSKGNSNQSTPILSCQQS